MDHLYYSIERAHSTDVNAVDETSQVVISGSGDGVVKIWMRPGETMSNIPSATISVRDRILSLLADPTGQKFAVGSSGTGDGPPLHILDIERLVNEHKNGVCTPGFISTSIPERFIITLFTLSSVFTQIICSLVHWLYIFLRIFTTHSVNLIQTSCINCGLFFYFRIQIVKLQFMFIVSPFSFISI